MAKKRRTFSAEQKVPILRRHLVDKVAVSDLYDEYGLNATVFYRWQKESFENGAAAFERRSDGRERRLQEKGHGADGQACLCSRKYSMTLTARSRR